MEISKILNADILDIIFEGRNKDYGAYQLRKTYNKRLTISVISMAAFIALLFAGYLLANNFSPDNAAEQMIVQDVDLENVKEEKPEPPPLPPPKPPEPMKVEMTKYTPPKIVPDDKVPDDEKPPEVEKLDNTKISLVNQEGIKDDGIIAPPIDDGKGVVAAPKKVEEDYDKTFTKVEIESFYPGGPPAWQRFLNKSFVYPQQAQDDGIQGIVMVQFIVDKDGNVSEVQAVSGPKELYAEAVRVVKKSGKWTPAVQNGRQVKSYKKQPIHFQIQEQ